MNEPHPCVPDCALACEQTCALHPEGDLPPIVLEEALERFGREAVRGVCDTGRYRLPFYTWGQGPPLLFIHGVSDVSLAFVMPISRLAAQFRCVAYNLPSGRGDGARLARYTHADLVEDVWALLDHLGLRQAYVLGSSFGATIALRALRDRPERLPRAVLQGGFAYRPLSRVERFLARLGCFFQAPTARLPFRDKLNRKVNCGPFQGRPRANWEYFVKCSGQPPIAAFARQVLLVHETDLRPILPEIRQPVLLFCGERDPVIRRAHDGVLLQGLPNAGRVLVPGCGHVPSYSHPEVLAEVVRQFLTPARQPCAG